MTPPEFLFDGPADTPLTFVFAHGAGAAMDSAFMNAFAAGLGERGIRVARFEFPYMARRRAENRKFPPDRQPVLLETWRAVIGALGGPGRLAIGGKSMGGRVASLIADEAGVRGLACLGYPFHAAGRPEKVRVEHLENLKTRTLILQGERDSLGNRSEVADYALSSAIRVEWLTDGDHGFKPRKASGASETGNWELAIGILTDFLKSL